VDDTLVTVAEPPSSENDVGVAVSAAATAKRPPGLRRMRSLNLSLVLIGATALGGLSGCGNLESGESNSRDVYANLEACKADWGTPGDCEEISPSRSATGTTSYYGPRYWSRSGYYGYNATPRIGSRATGSVSSAPSRSGFGASASRHGSASGSSHSSGG
jgi:hypothetical protein